MFKVHDELNYPLIEAPKTCAKECRADERVVVDIDAWLKEHSR